MRGLSSVVLAVFLAPTIELINFLSEAPNGRFFRWVEKRRVLLVFMFFNFLSLGKLLQLW